MTHGKKPQLVQTLQANVTDFFQKFFNKHGRFMQCAMGCSQCCRVSLSVFPVEAQLIFSWWMDLTSDERSRYQQIWKSKKEHEKDVKEASVECFFLVEEKCSIYDVRPVICRSQGLPLKVAEFSAGSSESVEKYELSLCELNFKEESHLPVPGEWLDLERLNTLLAMAQRHTEERDIAPQILDISSRNLGRVPLSELGRLLLQNF